MSLCLGLRQFCQFQDSRVVLHKEVNISVILWHNGMKQVGKDERKNTLSEYLKKFFLSFSWISKNEILHVVLISASQGNENPKW